jgi:hypothetical protein
MKCINTKGGKVAGEGVLLKACTEKEQISKGTRKEININFFLKVPTLD